MDTNTVAKTVGRPKKPLAWPSGRFTINDLKKIVTAETDPKNQITRVGLQNKVKKAVKDGELVALGMERTSALGRPSAVYVVKTKPVPLTEEERKIFTPAPPVSEDPFEE